MARPKSNNCEYFPHVTSMRNHRKIKAIRTKFGLQGYAIWVMLLEFITEADGNEFHDDEMEIDLIAGDFGVSVTEMRLVLDYCISLELLFKNEDNFIYSESLNEKLKPVYDKRKVAKEISEKRKRLQKSSNYHSNSTSTGVTVTEMPQSKVKYSKVKRSKVIKEADSKISLPLDVPKEKTLFNKAVEYFCEYYEQQYQLKYAFESKDGQNLKLLLNKLKTKCREQAVPDDDENVLRSFQYYVSNATGNWILSNFSIPNLNSQFNTIIQNFKNNKNGITDTGKKSAAYDHLERAIREGSFE